MIGCGSYGLAVLDVFSRPTSLSAGVERLKAQAAGSQSWIDLTTTIMQLYRAGILREEGAAAPELVAGASGYDASPIHAAMLNDRVRTDSFIRGISEVVRPGDVVVDVGTGTGILALAAARAGARHVYAVEASGIGKLARAMFEVNGFADRITLVEGWSTRVSLPERADVLVSEMIGNEPLAEDVLEITADARARLLKPNPRLVPGEVKIWGLPVEVPQAKMARHAFTDPSLREWGDWYGFDFRPLGEAAGNTHQLFMINPHKARDWKTLGDPVWLAEVDFRTARDVVVDTRTVSTANASGRMNGLLGYFELKLGPTTTFSTHPALADEHNHWYSPVWVLPRALDLSPGDGFSVSYKHRAGEDVHTKVKVERCP